MLINLRNALMAGRRLPYDAEVEFLESTGTQYINTGFKADRSTVVKCAISVVSRSTNGYVVWGAGKGDGASGLYDAVALGEKYNSPSTLYLLDTYNNNNAQSISYGQDLLVECVLSDGSITINGTTTSHNYYTLNRTADYPIWVFGENLAGNLFRPSKIKLSFLQIWQNGVLVRDFIPVRKGTVGYLYDRVSRRLFGNAGTGDFVLGQDVVPVEYIESHRTEYIDTGITPSAATECNIDLMFTGAATQQFGTGRSSSSEWAVLLGYYQDKIAFWAGANQATRLSTHTVNERIMCGFSIPNGTYWLGSNPTTDANLTAPTTNCQTFALFARKNATNSFSGFCTMRAYSADISGVEGTRKYRPVRVGTEGAMMDVLTRRIYRNQGTGAFSYGNDLKYPISAE